MTGRLFGSNFRGILLIMEKLSTFYLSYREKSKMLFFGSLFFFFFFNEGLQLRLYENHSSWGHFLSTFQLNLFFHSRCISFSGHFATNGARLFPNVWRELHLDCLIVTIWMWHLRPSLYTPVSSAIFGSHGRLTKVLRTKINPMTIP